ncbi:MAG: sulfotransferase [Planctomycetota bacterium]|nr:MAG: sulfotransferase [Planctomycetota bacterium]
MGATDPIILIGAQRSGTTWLGDVLSAHPSVAYWSEPRHVWTRGFARRPDDVLTAQDATPRVARRIRRTFERFVRARGRERLAEKTPSNCLRIPFVRAVFPEARLLLILRDGRSVIESTERIMRSGMPISRIARRALQTPLTDWPAQAGRAASAIARKATGRPLEYWGVRPPGWRQWVGRDPFHVMLARQWVGAVGRAIDDARSLPEGSVLIFRYEDLVRDPATHAARIAEFCDLRDPELFLSEVTGTLEPSRVDRWRRTLDPAVLDDVRPILTPLLTRLGYEW